METTSENTPSPELEEYQWSRRCDVLFRAWVQFRYHRRRQRFFDLVDKGTKAATLVLGGSLFGQFFNTSVVALFISALGSLALIFGYGDRKQAHKELAEMAGYLIGSIERDPQKYSSEYLKEWWDDYLELCVKAPPPLKTLTLLVEHEQKMADGAKIDPLKFHIKHLFSQVLS